MVQISAAAVGSPHIVATSHVGAPIHASSHMIATRIVQPVATTPAAVTTATRLRLAPVVRVRHLGPRMNSFRSLSMFVEPTGRPNEWPASGHRSASVPIALSAMSDRTLVLLKPDTVERKLVGEVISRFEAKNLDVVAMDFRTLDGGTLARHYEEHVGKGFYDDLVEFMSRGPVVAMVIEGPEDTWEVVRGMMGATNPRKAAPGTIRGDLGILFTENLVHGSDSLASAEREIGIFFPNL